MYRFVALIFLAAVSNAQGPQAFQKVCGVCHAKDFVMAPRTKDQWDATIQKMVTLGAKGTDKEFATVIDYLMKSKPQSQQPAIRIGIGGGPGSGVEAGAKDKHIVDSEASARGRKIWAARCINCHGTQARGTDRGPNLIRSEMVLHDRYGNEIGPFLRKGHPSGTTSGATWTSAQVEDVSHFIHEQVYDTLRSSPGFGPHDIVTGDAKAGEVFFNGDGKCATCHSPGGDLAGIASRYDAAALQGRFLSPRASRGGRPHQPVTLTVTPPGAPEITGTPVVFDDFTVSLRDAGGNYHSWARAPALKVVRNDPYAVHDELLEKYTDKNMHDIVAYLVTLK
jgi:cytochrome c oxidase cbb3-type subunit 3